MKPLLVSSGEPAGVGPELCLALAGHPLPIVVVGDKELLKARALQIGLEIHFDDYKPNSPLIKDPNHLTVLSIPCVEKSKAGLLNPLNSTYVMRLLRESIERCLTGEFSALITAPVHKGVINQAGIAFTGHTEFLAEICKVKTVVMLLACDEMRVALVTTHLPLKNVSAAITKILLEDVITTLNKSLIYDFGVPSPKLFIAGLNPHAGEGGYLGREELDIINPVLSKLHQQGVDVNGPFPADTMFTKNNAKLCDAFVAMYHDQGLPVIKYADFGLAVNITLGLPIIRTSVDHGTAIDIAGTGLANSSSLLAAVEMASKMAYCRLNVKERDNYEN